jgi:hypothetical protein
LGHLEGQTVSLLVDGATHPDLVVTDGLITLNAAASVVHVGLAYESSFWTERIEAGSQDGTAQGKVKRIHKVVMRFWQTLGGKVGATEDTLTTIVFRTAADPLGSAPPLFDGDVEIRYEGTYETEGRIFVRQSQPLPMTLVGIMPQLMTTDG